MGWRLIRGVRYFWVFWPHYYSDSRYDGRRIGFIQRAICLLVHREDHYQAWGTLRCERCHWSSPRSAKSAGTAGSDG